MPSIPAIQHEALSFLSHQSSSQLLEQQGLGWQTILSFTSILFAGLQGTLAMESADPCRISFVKVILLLILEALEIIVVLAAEVFSFVDLRKVLQVRLQWLQWLPYCLLAYGIIGLAIDVFFTLYLANRSRVKWIPFSSIHDYENIYTRIIALSNLVITTILSVVLVGWRQRWWLSKSSEVSAEVAIAAANEELALSVGAMSFCLSWSLFLLISSMVLCIFFRKQLRVIARGLQLVRLKVSSRFRMSHFRKTKESVVSEESCASELSPVRREGKKEVGWNVLNFFERLLYPDKYKSEFQKISFPDRSKEKQSLLNRCFLLMLLHLPTSITPKVEDGRRVFQIEIQDGDWSHAESSAERIIGGEICGDGECESENFGCSAESSSRSGKDEVRIVNDEKHGEADDDGSINTNQKSDTNSTSADNSLNEARRRLPQNEAVVAYNASRMNGADAIKAYGQLGKVMNRYLYRTPLHVGNAIIHNEINGESPGDDKSTVLHIVLLIAEHSSLLPLLLCVVVAVVRMWDQLDVETFRALKELSDAVIVVSMVQLAVTLKHILWGRDSSSDADVPPFERSVVRQSAV